MNPFMAVIIIHFFSHQNGISFWTFALDETSTGDTLWRTFSSQYNVAQKIENVSEATFLISLRLFMSLN